MSRSPVPPAGHPRRRPILAALVLNRAALIMPSTLSIVKVVFPPAEQARAVSLRAGGAALGIPLGPGRRHLGGSREG